MSHPNFAGLVRIDIDHHGAHVRAPVWARDHIRHTPERRWNGNGWTVPTWTVPDLTDRLERAGYIVRTVEAGKPAPPLVLPRRKGARTGQLTPHQREAIERLNRQSGPLLGRKHRQEGNHR